MAQPATSLLLAVVLLGASCAALPPQSLTAKNTAEAETCYKRGGALFYKSEFDQAIKEFGNAIRLNPKNPKYFYCRVLPMSICASWTKPLRSKTGPSN